MVYAVDLKSTSPRGLRVRVPPSSRMKHINKLLLLFTLIATLTSVVCIKITITAEKNARALKLELQRYLEQDTLHDRRY